MPEGYAIEKDGKIYYAFFTDPGKPFTGEVELRGLKPGTYAVVAYVDGKNMGTVQAESGEAPRFKTQFASHLLLEVGAK